MGWHETTLPLVLLYNLSTLKPRHVWTRPLGLINLREGPTIDPGLGLGLDGIKKKPLPLYFHPRTMASLLTNPFFKPGRAGGVDTRAINPLINLLCLYLSVSKLPRALPMNLLSTTYELLCIMLPPMEPKWRGNLVRPMGEDVLPSVRVLLI